MDLLEVRRVKQDGNAAQQEPFEQGVASGEQPCVLPLGIRRPPDEGFAEGIALDHSDRIAAGKFPREVGLAAAGKAAENNKRRVFYRFR